MKIMVQKAEKQTQESPFVFTSEEELREARDREEISPLTANLALQLFEEGVEVVEIVPSIVR